MTPNPKAPPPEPGNTAPAFALSTVHGVEVKLTKALERGLILVEFLRGSWDPNSRKRLQELSARHEEMERSGLRVIAVVCETGRMLRHYLDEHPTPFPVVIDADRRVARAYGVWQRFSLPRGNLARPSSFLVDRCGYVRFAYRARLQVHAARLDTIISSARDVQPPTGGENPARTA